MSFKLYETANGSRLEIGNVTTFLNPAERRELIAALLIQEGEPLEKSVLKSVDEWVSHMTYPPSKRLPGFAPSGEMIALHILKILKDIDAYYTMQHAKKFKETHKLKMKP